MTSVNSTQASSAPKGAVAFSSFILHNIEVEREKEREKMDGLISRV